MQTHSLTLENFVCDSRSIAHQWKKVMNYLINCACLIVGPYEKTLKYNFIHVKLINSRSNSKTKMRKLKLLKEIVILFS